MDQPLYTHLRKKMREPLRRPVWPLGSRLVAFDPTCHAEPVHRLLAEAYRVGGGRVDELAIWWPAVRDDPEYDPALVFLAIDDQKVVGVALCWTSSFLKDLAVAASWRRRGLGEALLRHAFQVFRIRGASHLDLKVERDNPSGAERLYRRLGMVPVPQ